MTRRLLSVTGPPMSGKSTLWEGLESALGGAAVFVPDLARRALTAVRPETMARDQSGFQHFLGYEQLVAEERASAAADDTSALVVCDKSLIDAVGYWDVLVGAPWPTWADKVVGRYSLVVYCDPTDVTASPVGLSELHFAQRDRLAEAILAVAKESRTAVVTVSGSPERRVEQVLYHLDMAVVPRG